MSGLFYSTLDEDRPENIGVLKKCKGQIDAFQTLGVPMDFVSMNARGILLNGELKINYPLEGKAKWARLKRLWQFPKLILNYCEWKKYSFIYIRYTLSNPSFIGFLQKLKNQYPDLKIILEIPTWPYDKEPQGALHRMALQLDKYCRSQLHHCVDFVVHYGLDEMIYQIPTIPIQNGINLATIPVSKSRPSEHKIRLIGVATWSYFHALDRLIDGLAIYQATNPTVQIEVTIIGTGPALNEYKSKVNQKGLDQLFTFIGHRVGAELNVYFDEADIGIGTMGMFRKNVKLDSSLKHREYCARGLAFGTASEDPAFPSHLNFIHRIPSDNSPVDIHQLIQFFNQLKEIGIDKIKQEMRDYSETNLQWTVQMEKVIKKINAVL